MIVANPEKDEREKDHAFDEEKAARRVEKLRWDVCDEISTDGEGQA